VVLALSRAQPQTNLGAELEWVNDIERHAPDGSVNWR
jgi:hypothetical protein